MKKKLLANIVMVTMIVVIMAAGIITAAILRGDTEPLTVEGTSATLNDAGNGQYICTLEIRCDTILSYMDRLEEAKAPYVPASGYILAKTTVNFTEGETVFDVLQRVCQSASVQLEYSWSPLYDSYYVEGINHLYEFDCGPESGWMYMINDQFPNYGSSDYKIEDGDEIVWCYTCSGLGADVGAKQE